MLLYQILASIIHGKTQKCHTKNNISKISAPTWNQKFELPDGSYSVSDIQEYFEYILKKQGEKTNNLSIQLYINNKKGSHWTLKQGIILNF